MYWLLNRNSQLTLKNKMLLYKTILKPIWTYGIQFWDTAYSNIKILQRYQRREHRNNLLTTYESKKNNKKI